MWMISVNRTMWNYISSTYKYARNITRNQISIYFWFMQAFRASNNFSLDHSSRLKVLRSQFMNNNIKGKKIISIDRWLEMRDRARKRKMQKEKRSNGKKLVMKAWINVVYLVRNENHFNGDSIANLILIDSLIKPQVDLLCQFFSKVDSSTQT